MVYKQRKRREYERICEVDGQCTFVVKDRVCFASVRHCLGCLPHSEGRRVW